MFPRFVEAFGGAAFAAGTAYHADYSGAALWLAPGAAPDDEALAALMEETVPPDRRAVTFAVFEQMGSYHPHEEHWYLPLIGVDPLVQGKGVGSALLRHALKQCDALGIPAYLEATTPGSIRLYERHGFKRLAAVQVGDSPEIVPMLRRPW